LRGRAARQAYGLIGGSDACHPTTLNPCHTNLRATPEWNALFESFGEFYRDRDRGFVIAPVEFLGKHRAMESRGESLVGVYHSYRSHGPEPTKADLSLHFDPRVLCFIVSVVQPDQPELKVYRLFASHFEPADYRIVD